MHSEVIDYGNPDMICKDLQSKGNGRGCSGGLIQNQVLICGCFIKSDNPNGYSDTCEVLGQPPEEFFTMSYKRGFSSSIVIENRVSS